MPRLIVTAAAAAGIERCRRFLSDKDPLAARRAAAAIEDRFRILETHPEVGRPDSRQPELRQLVVPFGESGYVALYRFEPADDAVLILAFRHQREAGW